VHLLTLIQNLCCQILDRQVACKAEKEAKNIETSGKLWKLVSPLVQIVPPDVGHRECKLRLELGHPPWYETQTLQTAIFFAPFKQQLQAQTDAQERPVCLQQFLTLSVLVLACSWCVSYPTSSRIQRSPHSQQSLRRLLVC